MTTAAAHTQSHMTVGEFLDWSEQQADDTRCELVAGVPARVVRPVADADRERLLAHFGLLPHTEVA